MPGPVLGISTLIVSFILYADEASKGHCLPFADEKMEAQKLSQVSYTLLGLALKLRPACHLVGV